MIVRIRQLREGHNPTAFTIENPTLDSLLAEVDDLYAGGASALDVRVDLLRTRDLVRMTGAVKGDLAFDCARCLQRVERSLDLPVRWTFAPRAMLDRDVMADSEEGRRLDPEDLEVSFLSGDEVDLVDVVRELLLLELDPAPTCGVDTCRPMTYKPSPSLDPEQVEGHRSDPRWRALEALRGKLGDGDAN
ncbi:MAG: hypothetical protein EA398_09805 [Deltaproteobacteria bacterium]|nr:MAG: hypothetical protein EA398_09805 [Deltaproteobacteria bacterium]